MSETTRCHICARPLSVDADPLSGDCGGDCWGCIGQIEAKMGGDPADNISIGFIAKEIRWGWRNANGDPRPPAFFQNGGPHHCRVRWLHTNPDDPVDLWSELDANRKEIRKIEIWADGRVGYAFDDVESGGTRLGEGAIPLLDVIAADAAFDPEAISQAEFEAGWRTHVR